VFLNNIVCDLQVELFRELQMLNTDYLRQRALYNLQDLVTRYLTEDAVASDVNTATDNVSYEAARLRPQMGSRHHW
jgi:hypothetical protein